MTRLTITTVWLTGLPTWARVGTDARAANAPTSPKQQQQHARHAGTQDTIWPISAHR